MRSLWYISTCIQEPPTIDGECACKEYVYLNTDGGTGNVHKYQVNTDGSFYEIGSPWYDNVAAGETLTRPHGLGIDANGNVFIGESGRGPIRQLICDGEFVPATDFVISDGSFNIGSYDNVIYVNATRNGKLDGIYADDPCTGEALGFYCLTGLSGTAWRDWGFHVDPLTGMAYVTDSHYYYDVLYSAEQNDL